MSKLRTDNLESLDTGRSIEVDDIASRNDLAGDPAGGLGAALVNGAVIRVTSIAAMEALTGINNAQASLSDGRLFAFDSSNLSSEVTADTQQWKYIAPSSDATGASGAWVLIIAGEWQANWFIKPSDTTFNAAVAQAQQAGNPGQMLRLPDETLTLSDAYTDKLQFIGNSKASKLTAGAGASRIIDFGRHLGGWDYHEILNVTFDGNNKASDGVAFNDNSASPEYGGRWVFKNCNFEACKKGIFHETGNVGNRYINTSCNGNDFGIYAVNPADGSLMHTGATVVNGGEFAGSAKAAMYFNDSEDGTGGFTFKDIIVESNNGFGIFMDLHSNVPVSGVVFDNVWFESNHSSTTVNIDGTDYTPKDIRLDNVVAAEFRNMYINSLELNNSTVVASNCRIDSQSPDGRDLTIDSDSALVCDNLFTLGRVGQEPFVRSLATQQNTNKNENYSVRGPLATKYLPLGNGTLLYGNNFNGAGPWIFPGGDTARNAVSVDDGVISDSCAELVVPTGATNIGTDSGTPTPGKWAVWGIHAKLVSGGFSTATLGYSFTFGIIYTRLGQWVRSYGIQEIPDGVGDSRIYLINNTGSPATVRLADHYVVEFDTFQEAIEFCNARAAVRI